MPNFQKMTAAARKAVLDKLATTPERRTLLDQVTPELEDYLSAPENRRAWVIGSYASKKPNPGDLDILVDKDLDAMLARGLEEGLAPAGTKPSSGGKLHTIYHDWPAENGMAEESAEVYAHEGKKRYGSLNWKRILGLGGVSTGVGLAELLGSPNDAEAGLTPKIRKLYEQAFKGAGEGAFTLYHSASQPDDIINRGLRALPKDPQESRMNENFKPFGLYLSETPGNIPGHLSGNWSSLDSPNERFKSRFRPEFKSRGTTPVVRAVIPPSAKVIPKYENQLITEYQRFRRAYGFEGMDASPEMEHRIKTDWTQYLQRQGDVLRIDGVDGTQGTMNIPEYINLNPEKLSLFYDNKARTPDLGVTYDSRVRPDLANSGSVRQQLMNQLEAKGLNVPETANTPSTQIMEAIGSLNDIKAYKTQWKAKDPDWQKKADAWLNDPLEVLKTQNDDSTELQSLAQRFFEVQGWEGMGSKQKDDYVNEMLSSKSGLKWVRQQLNAQSKAAQASDDLGEYIGPGDVPGSRGFSPEVKRWLSEIEEHYGAPAEEVLDSQGYDFSPLGISKFIGQFKAASSLDHDLDKFILGIGAGGVALAGGESTAEASPLGKLKPESLIDSVKSSAMPRSESALDRVLGKTLNLHFGDGDARKPYEIVDVRRGKDDMRFVIVKDETGQRHQLPMTSDYLNSMLGAVGTKDYVKQFKAQGLQGKKIQSLKSLGIREAKKAEGPIKNDQLFRDWNAMQAAKAGEIDPALVNSYVYVKNQQNETLYLPKEYADFLEKKGHVKKLKR